MPLVYVALGVLTLAVVVLAAMMGELYAHVRQFAPQVARGPQPLTIPAPEGAGALTWPPDASTGSIEGTFNLLVLSTTCSNCKAVGAALGNDLTTSAEVRVCIVTPNHDAAVDFLASTNLRGSCKLYIDEYGTWCRSMTGIDVSPALLRVHDHRVIAGHSFESYADLIALITDTDLHARIAAKVNG